MSLIVLFAVTILALALLDSAVRKLADKFIPRPTHSMKFIASHPFNK